MAVVLSEMIAGGGPPPACAKCKRRVTSCSACSPADASSALACRPPK